MTAAALLLTLRILDGVILAARVGREWRTRQREAVARVRAMVLEGREPSPAEYAELDAESAALSAELERIYADKLSRTPGAA